MSEQPDPEEELLEEEAATQAEFSEEESEPSEDEGIGDPSQAVLWASDWTSETILAQLGRGNIELDATFVSRIDALGSKRGDAAHNSCSKALTVGVDPNAELKDIEDVLRDLLDLDARLDVILAAALSPIPRQTTYMVVPAQRGVLAKALINTLPGALQIEDYPEVDGDVAFALTYPVSYEVGLSYGKRLADFAKKMRGKRELPAKFQ